MDNLPISPFKKAEKKQSYEMPHHAIASRRIGDNSLLSPNQALQHKNDDILSNSNSYIPNKSAFSTSRCRNQGVDSDYTFNEAHNVEENIIDKSDMDEAFKDDLQFLNEDEN